MNKDEHNINYIKNMELSIFLTSIALTLILYKNIGVALYFYLLLMIGFIVYLPVFLVDGPGYNYFDFTKNFIVYNIATFISQLTFIALMVLTYKGIINKSLVWILLYPIASTFIKLVIFFILKFMVFLYSFDLNEIDKMKYEFEY